MHDDTVVVKIIRHKLMDGSVVADVRVGGEDGFVQFPTLSEEHASALYCDLLRTLATNTVVRLHAYE